jgi:hypothetical protein
MSYKDIEKKYNCKKEDIAKYYRNNSEENIEQFSKRVEE